MTEPTEESLAIILRSPEGKKTEVKPQFVGAGAQVAHALMLHLRQEMNDESGLNPALGVRFQLEPIEGLRWGQITIPMSSQKGSIHRT